MVHSILVFHQLNMIYHLCSSRLWLGIIVLMRMFRIQAIEEEKEEEEKEEDETGTFESKRKSKSSYKIMEFFLIF